MFRKLHSVGASLLHRCLFLIISHHISTPQGRALCGAAQAPRSSARSLPSSCRLVSSYLTIHQHLLIRWMSAGTLPNWGSDGSLPDLWLLYIANNSFAGTVPAPWQNGTWCAPARSFHCNPVLPSHISLALPPVPHTACASRSPQLCLCSDACTLVWHAAAGAQQTADLAPCSHVCHANFLSPVEAIPFPAALSIWYTDSSTRPLTEPDEFAAQAAKHNVQTCDLRCPARQRPAVPDRRRPGGPNHAHRQSRGESAGHAGCTALM